MTRSPAAADNRDRHGAANAVSNTDWTVQDVPDRGITSCRDFGRVPKSFWRDGPVGKNSGLAEGFGAGPCKLLAHRLV